METKKSEDNTNICHTIFDWIGFGALYFIALGVSTWVMSYLFATFVTDKSMWKWPVSVVAALLVVSGVTHFIYAFTRDLSSSTPDNSAGQDDSESLSPQLRAIFIYGYTLTLLALVFSVTPFFISIDKRVEAYKSPSAAGIVVGCYSENCEAPQWFLHIGSSIFPMPEETSQKGDADSNTPSGASNQFYYLLKGGLTVPLYVVVLALMGAAIGMVRRVPEYQMQATRQYKEEYEENNKPDNTSNLSTDKKLPINDVRARELVIFQIMQVFAAPLIAVTAFAALRPETVAAGVLLGFLSGFASEMILLQLRKAAEAMSGGTKKAAPQGSAPGNST